MSRSTGFISSTQDEVIVGRSGIVAASFEAQLRAAMAEIEEDYPDRARSIISGTNEHTFIIKQFEFPVANTTVRQWVTDMLSRGDNWVSVSD